MEPPNQWNRLSQSSKKTLLWAAALAHHRTEQGRGNPSAQADTFDLLVGMILEHPADAEPKILLEHYGLVPGHVLPLDYPRPTSEDLQRHLARIPAGTMPPLNDEALKVVEHGISIGMSSGSADVAELRAMFAAMLELSNPAASALDELLSPRGATVGEISRSTREYTEKYAPKIPYAEFLQERHPYSPRPIDIPNYKADQAAEADLAHDLVDIRAEVDAFAYLLSSRGLEPPLAVGLFGDWGSGKSFFMEAVRRRIERLTGDPALGDRPQSEVPFWKRIIQIQFNAWHYVEGELWASLVEHIFSQLRLSDETDDLVEQRRKHWLEKLDQTRLKMARLETKRLAAVRDLEQKQQQAELLRRHRDSELDRLQRLKTESTADIVLNTSVAEVKKALEPFFLSIGLPTADEIFKTLDSARTELRRGRTLLAALWRSPRHLAWVVVLLVAVPVLVWLLTSADVPALAAAFSGVSAAAAGSLVLVRRAIGLVGNQLSVLDKAEEKARAELKEAKGAINKKIDQAEKNIQQADKRLQSVVGEQEKLSEEVKKVQDELAAVTPSRVLNDFVAERVGSGDYRRHLGIPALIQQDFKQLSRLVARQNQSILQTGTGDEQTAPECFNRIILYIDDLDRCRDSRVIEVLQAVHLLLAFDLFVVVVAVDSRWLSHALTKHFEALSSAVFNGNEATPDDYLEKIFQIPFWVQPLSDKAKRNIVDGLLRSHLAGGDGAPSTEDSGDKPTLGDLQRRVLSTLDPANAPPNLSAAALAITRDELGFLDELAPLLGLTPRSVKRFVNLYQLIRIIYRLDSAETDETPPDCELLAFILAIGDGLPQSAPALMQLARVAAETDTLTTLLETASSAANSPELQSLQTWLDERPAWGNISAGRLSEAFRKVDRFLFRVGSARCTAGSETDSRTVETAAEKTPQSKSTARRSPKRKKAAKEKNLKTAS